MAAPGRRKGLAIGLGAAALAGLLGSCVWRARPEKPPVSSVSEPAGLEDTTGAHLLDESVLFHRVRVDGQGRLLSWVEEGAPFARVPVLAWQGLQKVPVQPNGYKTYFVSSMFSGEPGQEFGFERDWVHHPAGLGAMLVDSAIMYSAYAADPSAIDEVRPFLDHILTHGRTGPDEAWASVPYACSNWGELRYGGANEVKYCPLGQPACGIGDGEGTLEPDKVGEMGHAFARLHQATGDPRYLDAARLCADALVTHVRPGHRTRSPWPFRVDARTGARVREDYGANVLGPIKLFDEMARLGQGDLAAYARVRGEALAWLLAYPVRTHLWDGYFEDIAITAEPGENGNQYTPLETARYLMDHPEVDPAWSEHVAGILAWVTESFAGDVQHNIFERGRVHGAEVISEQRADMAKMASHTARFASVLARYHELTGAPGARERAFRSFNWATYACDERGVVDISPNRREGLWFSDGYGDYIRHFLAGMASIPDWAPAGEAHVLRSSSVLRRPARTPSTLSYSAFDDHGEEILRLPRPPRRVTLDDQEIGPGKTLPIGHYESTPLASGGVRLRLVRARGRQILVDFGP
jgi:hypothetical protein